MAWWTGSVPGRTELPGPSRAGEYRLILNQADIARPRSLPRLFRHEFDALALAQQLEYCPANGAAMKKMLNAAFIPNEPETLVDQEPCDSARRHSRILR